MIKSWLRSQLSAWLARTPMPLWLTYVRHGESEGNVAAELIRQGRYDEIPVEMHGVPGWKWRLTPRGCRQAELTGDWLRQFMPDGYDIGFVSTFTRAEETAGLLGDIGSSARFRWRPTPVIRERDYGRLDCVPFPQDLEYHLRYMASRKVDKLFWTPPGGESIYSVASSRQRDFGHTLRRHYSNKRVVVVAHGELIQAGNINTCRICPADYEERRAKNDPLLQVLNCQVVTYTRVNPETGAVSETLDWVRSVCPSAEEPTDTGWLEIIRPKYTSTELLAKAQRMPRYFEDAA